MGSRNELRYSPRSVARIIGVHPAVVEQWVEYGLIPTEESEDGDTLIAANVVCSLFNDGFPKLPRNGGDAA